jgi:hypothetical protein
VSGPGRVIVIEPGSGAQTSILVVAKDYEILAQCEGIVVARMENPLRVENCLVEPNPQAHPLEGIYISKPLFKIIRTYQ